MEHRRVRGIVIGTEGAPRHDDADRRLLGQHVAGLHRRGVGAQNLAAAVGRRARSEEHTSELQSLMRISYAVFCLKKKKQTPKHYPREHRHPTSTTKHKTTQRTT